jgi:hypothetical protein
MPTHNYNFRARHGKLLIIDTDQLIMGKQEGDETIEMWKLKTG